MGIAIEGMASNCRSNLKENRNVIRSAKSLKTEGHPHAERYTAID